MSTYYINQSQPKRYGCLSFLFDITMVFLTAGFWFIWIFVREMRKQR